MSSWYCSGCGKLQPNRKQLLSHTSSCLETLAKRVEEGNVELNYAEFCHPLFIWEPSLIRVWTTKEGMGRLNHGSSFELDIPLLGVDTSNLTIVRNLPRSRIARTQEAAVERMSVKLRGRIDDHERSIAYHKKSLSQAKQELVEFSPQLTDPLADFLKFRLQESRQDSPSSTSPSNQSELF